MGKIFGALILLSSLCSELFALEYSIDTFGKTLPNFGLLVNNQHYTLYRSTLLGKIGLPWLKHALEDRDLPFPKTIVYMNTNGYKGWIPWYGVGALGEYDKQEKYGYEFFHSYRYDYRTYLDGHDPYHPRDDIDAEDNLGKKAIKLFGVIEDNEVDGDVDDLVRIMHLILDPSRQPVLFHCLGGRHRTGMVALIIRYLQGGQWLEGRHEVEIKYEDDASGEKLEKVFVLNSAQYEYYLHNSDLFRPENLEFVEQFQYDERFGQLQTLYGAQLRE